MFKSLLTILLSSVVFLAVFGLFGLLSPETFTEVGLLTVFLYILSNILIVRG